MNIDENNPEWLEAESTRRLFWAIWFTQCVNADHESTANPVNERIRSLHLPISEPNYHHMIQQTPKCFADIELPQQRSQSDDNYSLDYSVMAEAMSLIVIW